MFSSAVFAITSESTPFDHEQMHGLSDRSVERPHWLRVQIVSIGALAIQIRRETD